MRTAACIGVITIFCGIVALSLAALSASPAWAAAHTVNTPADHDDGTCDGTDCTLREAVVHAGTGDTVTFASANTYILDEGEIVIDKSLTIQGLDGGVPGDVIISGGWSNRVFKITTCTVSIKNLTITNGYTDVAPGGGGIMNAGTLTLDNVVVSNCVVDSLPGGGIWSGEATLTITGSRITGNTAQGSSTAGVHGGGIYCEGDSGNAVLNMTNTVVSLNQAEEKGGGLCAYWTDAAITRCTFDQNQQGTSPSSSAGGGGLNAHESEVHITDSEFTGNQAAWGGGGVSGENYTTLSISGSTFYNNSAASGGGLRMSGEGLLTVSNSTFSDNASNNHGGGLMISGLATGTPASSLSFVTITNNTADADCGVGGTCNNGDGGGLFFGVGSLKFKGVILAGNADQSLDEAYRDVFVAADLPQSEGYNLIGDNTGAVTAFPAGTPNGNNDYVGAWTSPLTGVVQAIADNGGPTQTCALSPGSLAINHGPPDCCDVAGCTVTSDQRGLGRNRGGRPDIGAYEVPAGGGSALVMLLE